MLKVQVLSLSDPYSGYEGRSLDIEGALLMQLLCIISRRVRYDSSHLRVYACRIS